MKPKTQMRIGLWGIITLTFLGVSHFIFKASNTSAMVIDFINLILFVVYILGIIRKKLTSVRMVFRVYLVFFVIFFVGLFLAMFIPTASTGKWTELPMIGLVMIIIIPLCAIPIIIMRMGLRGLERVLEIEGELRKTGNPETPQ